LSLQQKETDSNVEENRYNDTSFNSHIRNGKRAPSTLKHENLSPMSIQDDLNLFQILEENTILNSESLILTNPLLDSDKQHSPSTYPVIVVKDVSDTSSMETVLEDTLENKLNEKVEKFGRHDSHFLVEKIDNPQINLQDTLVDVKVTKETIEKDSKINLGQVGATDDKDAKVAFFMERTLLSSSERDVDVIKDDAALDFNLSLNRPKHVSLPFFGNAPAAEEYSKQTSDVDHDLLESETTSFSSLDFDFGNFTLPRMETIGRKGNTKRLENERENNHVQIYLPRDISPYSGDRLSKEIPKVTSTVISEENRMNLGNRAIRSIPDDLDNDLTHLSLEGNLISFVPTLLLSSIVNIRMLNLSDNLIETLSPEIDQLVNLEFLYLRGNQIREVYFY
jgi:Leucine-rich repeat (LRR) protein